MNLEELCAAIAAKKLEIAEHDLIGAVLNLELAILELEKELLLLNQEGPSPVTDTISPVEQRKRSLRENLKLKRKQLRALLKVCEERPAPFTVSVKSGLLPSDPEDD